MKLSLRCICVLVTLQLTPGLSVAQDLHASSVYVRLGSHRLHWSTMIDDGRCSIGGLQSVTSSRSETSVPIDLIVGSRVMSRRLPGRWFGRINVRSGPRDSGFYDFQYDFKIAKNAVFRSTVAWSTLVRLLGSRCSRFSYDELETWARDLRPRADREVLVGLLVDMRAWQIQHEAGRLYTEPVLRDTVRDYLRNPKRYAADLARVLAGD